MLAVGVIEVLLSRKRPTMKTASLSMAEIEWTSQGVDPKATGVDEEQGIESDMSLGTGRVSSESKSGSPWKKEEEERYQFLRMRIVSGL